MKKRYQYISKDGIKWTNWFVPYSNIKHEYQFKYGKFILKNEYSDKQPD